MEAVGEVTAISKAGEPQTPGAWVELRGEFDISDLQRPRNVFDGASGSRPPVHVDLSGVTFLDVRCARELTVRCLSRGGRLALLNSSWQAAASLEACEHARRAAYDKTPSRSTGTRKRREPSVRNRAGRARFRG